MKRYLLVLALLAGCQKQPDYYWYDVAQTDSVRALLDAEPVGSVRLRLQFRPKGSTHIWVGVMPVDSLAKLQAGFEVQESWPCPPRCEK